jgi:SAM-dependent methyltransferase
MKLFCQKCKNELDSQKNRCNSCNTTFAFNENYIDYEPANNFYWGEIEKTDMESLIKLSKNEGYKKACFKFFKTYKRKSLFTYILSKKDRISFLNFVYSKKHSGRALDLGSGFGTIPQGMSELFDEVYSIENIKERVEFQSIIKSQDNINNWQIIKGDIRSLPFPDNYFDFVSVNGVLEWIGISDPKKNPRVSQLEFLSEIKRVLKPDGVCYVGIENRIGRQYFRGAKDHSGLPFTSLVPRFVASIICNIKQKGGLFFHDAQKTSSGYLTYTYSLSGYKKLLKDIGVNNFRIFHTSFSYNQAYAGLDDVNVKHVHKNRKIISRHLTQFKYGFFPVLSKFFSQLSPNFLIYFRKNDEPIISDLEKNISENSPLYIYKGFNSLSAFSITENKFYKAISIDSCSEIKKENLIDGLHPEKINEKIFSGVLELVKNKYYVSPTRDSQKFTQILNIALALAKKYELDISVTENYLKNLAKYENEPIFSKTHGDLWRENIIIDKNGKIDLIDEENDEFGLIPIEISRFTSSIVGYGDNSSNQYQNLVKTAINALKPLKMSENLIKDFYILSLFYELKRRDFDAGVPRMELFTFVKFIENSLK